MAKFEQDHPLRGRHMQVGRIEIGHIRLKTYHNSITLQDKTHSRIEVVYALSNGYVANDLW